MLSCVTGIDSGIGKEDPTGMEAVFATLSSDLPGCCLARRNCQRPFSLSFVPEHIEHDDDDDDDDDDGAGLPLSRVWHIFSRISFNTVAYFTLEGPVREAVASLSSTDG